MSNCQSTPSCRSSRSRCSYWSCCSYRSCRWTPSCQWTPSCRPNRSSLPSPRPSSRRSRNPRMSRSRCSPRYRCRAQRAQSEDEPWVSSFERSGAVSMGAVVQWTEIRLEKCCWGHLRAVGRAVASNGRSASALASSLRRLRGTTAPPYGAPFGNEVPGGNGDREGVRDWRTFWPGTSSAEGSGSPSLASSDAGTSTESSGPRASGYGPVGHDAGWGCAAAGLTPDSGEWAGAVAALASVLAVGRGRRWRRFAGDRRSFSSSRTYVQVGWHVLGREIHD
jgi:hypothetical protein